MKVIYIRKKYLYFILTIFVGLIILKFVISSLVIPTHLPIGNKIIGIDPGHGGIDSGALGKSGVSESEINLAISLKLKRIIEQSGGIVVITRNDNSGLYTEKSKTIKEKKNEDLRNRKEIINENNCDIFLTIHLNSFPQSKYNGAQTFYEEDCEDSKKLAYIVQDELKNVLDENNKRIPQSKEDIYLLREVEAPSILIECGFLSNPEEEKLLQDDKYQEKVAWAIYSGIMRYFNEIENIDE